jgi:hypothetical protein
MRPCVPTRHGIASVWLLAIIAFLAAVTALIGNEVVQSRAAYRTRISHLQAEWLARGALEKGMRECAEAAMEGQATLPTDLLPGANGLVTWKPLAAGQMRFIAEATAGEIPNRSTRRFSVVANRRGGAWGAAGPVERVANTLKK